MDFYADVKDVKEIKKDIMDILQKDLKDLKDEMIGKTNEITGILIFYIILVLTLHSSS